VDFVHIATPRADFSDIDLSTTFLHQSLSTPILIEAMTGGTLFASKINQLLARAATRYGLSLALGSLRPVLEDPSTLSTYLIARREAPDAFLIINIGAAQLLKGTPNTLSVLETAASKLEASALAVHFNPLQELIMPEGDPVEMLPTSERISEVRARLGIPIIAKEVGCGVSRETALLFEEAGFDAIDIGGWGGTNWALVEGLRAGKARDLIRSEAAASLHLWGIPTLLSLLEVRSVVKLPVIVSGGIRSGITVAKALALGGDLVGIARPFLKAAATGEATLFQLCERLIFELRAAIYLTGGRCVSDLKQASLYLDPSLLQLLKTRGIELVR